MYIYIFFYFIFYMAWDQDPLILPDQKKKTDERREKTQNARQNNKPIWIWKKKRQDNKGEMEEFTVENFHSAICRHIRGPKEQFNYGMGGEGRAGGSGQWK